MNNMVDYNKIGFLGSFVDEWFTKNEIIENSFYKFSLELNSYAHPLQYTLIIHNEDPQELLVAALFIRSLSIYQGSIILIQKGMIAESKILLRSLLEVLFKITAIAKDKNFMEDFIHQDQINRKKNINRIKKLSTDIKIKYSNIDFESKYAEIINIIDENNIKQHSTEWYAEKAGLLDEYYTAYNIFSGTTHASVRDLESYFNIKNDKIVSFNIEPNIKDIDELLMTGTECIIKILKSLNDVFSLSIDDKIKEFGNHLIELVKNNL